MKNFYDKLVIKSTEFCKKKNSKFYLYFISFIESIIFPLPTDIFLIPYVLANKKNYLRISVIVSIFSVLGGIFAYFIGFFVWNEIEPTLSQIFPNYISKLKDFNEKFYEIGLILVVIGGFSPFPYKITCIGSGILGINILPFIVFSFLSRFLRFYLVSFFVYKYGEKTNEIVGKYINVISLGLVFFLLIYLLFL